MSDELTDRESVRAAEALVGGVLSGKWRLDRLLGVGGMASVYAATHRNGRRAAIKVLSRALAASTRARQRFLREGYIANRVGHPGAVAVLDDDSSDGRVFLVMEYLEGLTLEQLRRERGGVLPANEASWIGVELLEVLAAAHGKKIIHRDVKPTNVLLTVQGELKLLDFGIASLRELSEVATLSEQSAVLGTPGYMAPEQARGRAAELGVWTDIWALGATLFRLLSGRLVHDGQTSAEMLIAAATQPPPSLSSPRPDLPRELIEVVDRALRLEPSERWQSAAEMGAALRRAARHLPPLQGIALPALEDTLDAAPASLASEESLQPSAATRSGVHRDASAGRVARSRRLGAVVLGISLAAALGATAIALLFTRSGVRSAALDAGETPSVAPTASPPAAAPVAPAAAAVAPSADPRPAAETLPPPPSAAAPLPRPSERRPKLSQPISGMAPADRGMPAEPATSASKDSVLKHRR